MYREEKGFSIAEALITLMIVSLILAAVLPVVSKKSKTSDTIWHYVSNGVGANSDVYYGASNSQSAIIGNTSAPDSSKGSRLVIVTPEDSSGDTIQRSLIDFYQKTSTGMTNIGRIAFDNVSATNGYGNSGNTAIGKNTLINNIPSLGQAYGMWNTALGSESLYHNSIGYHNTGLGDWTLYNNTTGTDNVAIGSKSQYYTSTASGNTSLGTFSLGGLDQLGLRSEMLTGNYNTSAGYLSMRANENGENNTALGAFSLTSNKTGSENTSIGTGSLYHSTNASFNVAMGSYALAGYQEGRISQNTGYKNVAMGYASMLLNTTGYENAAIGFESMRNNTVGWHNAAFGHLALTSNTTGYDNTAIGTSALYSNTTGHNNTAIGMWVLRNNTAGNHNTSVGRGSLLNAKGSQNISIGFGSGLNIVNGGGNIVIGTNAGPSTNTSNQLFIHNSQTDSPLIWGDFSAGTVNVNGAFSATSVTQTSDRRVKNIIGDNKIGLERILKLNVREFTFKGFPYDKRKHTGVIAQELQKIIPNAVVEGPGNDKYKTLLYIDANEILFTCVNAIKQLYSKMLAINSRIVQLELENNKQQKEINELKDKIKMLDSKVSKR